MLPRSFTETRAASGRLARLAGLLALVAATACAPRNATKAYVSPWMLTGRETIAVSVRNGDKTWSLPKPVPGAGRGASQGAGEALAGAWSDCSGDALVICILITPFAVAGGAAVGAARSHTAAATESATASLLWAIQSTRPWRDVEAALLAKGRVQPSGPSLRRSTGGYPRLEVDTHMSFVPSGPRYDPMLTVVIYATGTLRMGPGQTPVTASWSERSGPYDFFDLAEDNGGPMRGAIHDAAVKSAGAIRGELALAVRTQKPGG